MAKNFEHISHIKSRVTKVVEPEEFYGLTPTADNSDNVGSSPVKLNIAKRPSSDDIIDGEIAVVNDKKGHETLTIKNDENEIVGFVNENELYETQEIIAKGLGKLKEETSSNLSNLEERVTNVENKMEEFDEGIDDLELVISSSLNDLNRRVNGLTEKTEELQQTIDDDGLVISSSLNDLNDRVDELNETADSVETMRGLINTLSRVVFNNYQYVDLGLPSRTLWAKYNVGAEFETDYGNYYMYGMGNKLYDSTDTPYAGTESPLDISADTATRTWGGLWHMPTREQCQELIDNTSYEWVIDYKESGVNGGLFTASNGNSIFIPAADSHYEEMGGGSHTPDGSCGIIWSSTPKDNNDAFTLYFSEDNLNVDFSSHILGNGRDSGLSIRPVIG